MIKLWKIFGVELHPIGDVVINTTGINPSNRYKGTWELISKGRTLVGVDENDTDFNVPKKTGGHKKLQKHDHGMIYSPTSAGDAISRLPYVINSGGATDSTGGRGWTNMSTLPAGEGNSGNLQPYFTCYIWERVA